MFRMVMSKLLPEVARLARGRCIIDGGDLSSSLGIKASRRGRGLPGLSRTTGAESHARQVYVGKTPTASALPPTLSTTQEISAANVSRHSAGATRRPKTTTTASWRLALPWLSPGAGWLVSGRGHRKDQFRVLGSHSALHANIPRKGRPPGGRGVRGPDFFR